MNTFSDSDDSIDDLLQTSSEDEGGDDEDMLLTPSDDEDGNGVELMEWSLELVGDDDDGEMGVDNMIGELVEEMLEGIVEMDQL